MKKLVGLGLMALLALPASGMAASTDEQMIQQLQQQIQQLSSQLATLAQKVEENKKAAEAPKTEIKELTKRVDAAEKHSVLDRIEFSGDLRVKADSVHYDNVTFNPGIMVDFDKFGMDAMNGVFGNPMDPNSPLAQMMAANPALAEAFMGGQLQGVMPYSLIAKPDTSDINNDILYTTRLRLNMKAKVWDNVKFNGRLTMYKNWGDSTGTKVFDSWNSFTMDGTDSGNTTGDYLRVERAFFDWNNIAGTPLFFSVGRRPSTYGPPSNIRENELRGGTPSGHLVNFNFDGITIGYGLEELTGIPGMTARFCYGQGYESEWGNGEMFNQYNAETKDTHLGGFNIDVYNDDTNFVQLTLFSAQDINDGFKGTIAFPTEYAALFAPTMYQDLQGFPTFNFVTRVQPSTVIGDMNLAGLLFQRTEDNGVKWFTSFGWTQMRPNGKAGMFGGMGTDAVYQAELNADGTAITMVPKVAENDDTHDGYGVYVGIQTPAPMGKFGLEYNYGSKYWTPFTQAQDDVVGSKLATRGHVGEAYYIVDINPHMFLKLSGLYYDFEYSGSGSPVGKPQDIDDVIDGKAYSMLPVVDKAYDINASLTLQF